MQNKMRLYIDNHFFISVILKDKKYSCQVMELVHGSGMYPATITDNQENVVSCIVYDDFTETSKLCNNLQEIVDFHTQCLLDLERLQLKNECELK